MSPSASLLLLLVMSNLVGCAEQAAPAPSCSGTYRLSQGALAVHVTTTGPATILVAAIDQGPTAAIATSDLPAGMNGRDFLLTVDPPIQRVTVQVKSNGQETDCQAQASG